MQGNKGRKNKEKCWLEWVTRVIHQIATIWKRIFLSNQEKVRVIVNAIQKVIERVRQKNLRKNKLSLIKSHKRKGLIKKRKKFRTLKCQKRKKITWMMKK